MDNSTRTSTQGDLGEHLRSSVRNIINRLIKNRKARLDDLAIYRFTYGQLYAQKATAEVEEELTYLRKLLKANE